MTTPRERANRLYRHNVVSILESDAICREMRAVEDEAFEAAAGYLDSYAAVCTDGMCVQVLGACAKSIREMKQAVPGGCEPSESQRPGDDKTGSGQPNKSDARDEGRDSSGPLPSKKDLAADPFKVPIMTMYASAEEADAAARAFKEAEVRDSGPMFSYVEASLLGILAKCADGRIDHPLAYELKKLHGKIDDLKEKLKKELPAQIQVIARSWIDKLEYEEVKPLEKRVTALEKTEVVCSKCGHLPSDRNTLAKAVPGGSISIGSCQCSCHGYLVNQATPTLATSGGAAKPREMVTVDRVILAEYQERAEWAAALLDKRSCSDAERRFQEASKALDAAIAAGGGA